MSRQIDTLADALQSAFCGHEPDAFAGSCTPDVHYEDPLTTVPLDGPTALGAHVARLWSAFPDARLEQSGARLTDGRFAALPIKLLATHTGELPELPPTGRFVVLQAVLYTELGEDGERFLRIRAFFDLYDTAIQLGVLPKPGSAGERALLLLRGFGLRRA